MSYALFTALATLFLLVCVGLGLIARRQAERPWLAAVVAALMVATQFALLVLR
jgi:hypothetical protein